MTEPDDEKPSSGFHLNFNRRQKTTRETAQPQQPHAVYNHHHLHQLMDLDMVDLDSSWPLDQISFVPNPMSPFFISSSDQPFSPIWAFSDADDDNKASLAASGGGSVKQGSSITAAANGFRLPEYPRFLARV